MSSKAAVQDLKFMGQQRLRAGTLPSAREGRGGMWARRATEQSGTHSGAVPIPIPSL